MTRKLSTTPTGALLLVLGATALLLSACTTGDSEDAGEPDDDPTGTLAFSDAAPLQGNNVTLCHATGSADNPYSQVTVSKSSILNGGHDTHDGDVIPPFDDYPGKNWPPPPGLNADCTVDQPTTTTTSTPSTSTSTTSTSSTTTTVDSTTSTSSTTTTVDSTTTSTTGPVDPTSTTTTVDPATTSTTGPEVTTTTVDVAGNTSTTQPVVPPTGPEGVGSGGATNEDAGGGTGPTGTEGSGPSGTGPTDAEGEALEELPRTGSDEMVLALWATLAVLVGLAMVRVSDRRSRAR